MGMIILLPLCHCYHDIYIHLKDVVNGYQCTCAPGYTGRDCDTDINECASSPCVHGTCNVSTTHWEFSSLSVSLGENLYFCISDIPMCTHYIYQNLSWLQIPQNLIAMYTCTCDQGYLGTNCQTDIDDCVSNPCQNGASCNVSVPM